MILMQDIVHFCAYLIHTRTLNTMNAGKNNKVANVLFKVFIQTEGFLSNQAHTTIMLNIEID